MGIMLNTENRAVQRIMSKFHFAVLCLTPVIFILSTCRSSEQPVQSCFDLTALALDAFVNRDQRKIGTLRSESALRKYSERT
jgi:hypothetical protein